MAPTCLELEVAESVVMQDTQRAAHILQHLDAATAETILLLGRSLGFEVIAEGVETDTQVQFFQNRQCQLRSKLLGRTPPACRGFISTPRQS